MMITELKTIAKQVSLLNRLLGLLMMQEEPFEVTRYTSKCVEYSAEEFNLLDPSEKYFADGSKKQKWISLPPEYIGQEMQDNNGEAFTQKAWSDELVRVARELKESIPCFIEDGLHLSRIYLGQPYDVNPLEAILNKYERSLSE